MATKSGGSKLDRATMLALVAMICGVFLIANDFTALSVAIDSIEDDLDTSLNRAQWVINIYTVIFGVLIVTGGRLADLYGRKKIFIIGAAIFAIFSLLGGLADSIGQLIAARGLMGIGGAMVWPAVLGMTYAILPKEKAGFAGALIIGVAGVGNAFGPLLGGFLTDALSWRWIFFVNVPVAILAIIVTYKFVKEPKVSGSPKIDYKGIAALSAGVIAILVALDQGTVVGFSDSWILTLFAAGILLLLWFMRIEKKEGSTALVPEEIVKNKQFLASIVSIVLISAIYFSALVYIPQFTQNELGWTAAEAGVGLLPLMLVFAAASFLAGGLYNQFGAKKVVAAGAFCLTFGILLISILLASGTYSNIVAGMIVLGAGVGLYYSAITTAAVTSVKESQSSLAGGIVYMCNVAGGSIGLGLNTAIVLSASSFVEGIRIAFIVDAVLGVISLAVILLFIKDEKTTKHKHRAKHHRAHA